MISSVGLSMYIVNSDMNNLQYHGDYYWSDFSQFLELCKKGIF